MSITKSDCLLFLKDLEDKGLDTKPYIAKALKSENVDLEVLKFINENRQLDVTRFYEKLRKSYNQKKSKLYINIVKEKFDEPKDILITLSSLNLQILLYNKQVENSTIFLNNVRFNEITACLYNYSKTKNIIPCQKLLQLIKTDLKALEFISKPQEESTI